MCVILVGKVSEVLKLDLYAAWASNPHGAGLLVHSPGRVQCIKGLMDLDSLIGELEKVDRHRRVAVHLRWATHGSINAANTHPFAVGRGSWLMHNGVLSAFGKSGDRGVSDSADLARVLGQIKGTADRCKVLRSLSGMFVLATREGFGLFGSRSWQSVGRVKCSNTHWVPSRLFAVDDVGECNGSSGRSPWGWRELV